MRIVEKLVDELNDGAAGHSIGNLQRLRKELKGLSRLPTQKLFLPQSTFDHYAFHVGGRTELQFNIGIESLDDGDWLRYGVAFSLRKSQALSDIYPLIPGIKKFNEFLRLRPEEFGDLRMWHYVDDVRSDDYYPSPIPDEIVETGNSFF
jgi:hypothetical protein